MSGSRSARIAAGRLTGPHTRVIEGFSRARGARITASGHIQV